MSVSCSIASTVSLPRRYKYNASRCAIILANENYGSSVCLNWVSNTIHYFTVVPRPCDLILSYSNTLGEIRVHELDTITRIRDGLYSCCHKYYLITLHRVQRTFLCRFSRPIMVRKCTNYYTSSPCCICLTFSDWDCTHIGIFFQRNTCSIGIVSRRIHFFVSRNVS